ncbi:MAG TPA: DHA2 family efflux MFS transporter permease subunit [Chitinophagaceae bacterium]|jgi:DHA2 family multidrug resistance protein|nr:DHA2 family efflux MFS transporter permease subunit [Chitinophagaceae bacterium]
MLQQQSLVEYGSRRAIITITAILCALLEIVDTTIVNVSLNEMQGNLGATTTEIGWVITAYAIGNVIIVPMTSFFAAQFGRRNYFAASIILFTISSFLCGNANGIWELVAFRFLQGLGGGALLVTSQTIITESYPPEKRGMAQAIYGMGVIVGPTLGPPLGGYITQTSGWRNIFYINIPLGIIAALLTLQYVRSPRYAQKSKSSDIDWAGIGLLAIFVGSLQYVLEKGHDDDWFASKTIIFFTATAVFAGFFFLWRELTFHNPVVQLRVLKNRNLAIGTILSFVMGFGLYGSTFIIPLYTQQILGWTPLQAGMLMVPAALTTAFLMPFMGKMLQGGARPNLLISLGMLIFFFFCFWGFKVMTPDTGKDAFFWPLIMRGIAMALLFIPITMMSLSTLKGRQIGDGAAFTGMMRQLGGSFGIALITTFMAQQMMVHRSTLVAKLDATNGAVIAKVNALKQGFIVQGATPEIALQKAYKVLDGGVMKQAAVLSYMDVFLYIGLIFLICIPFVLLIKTNKKRKEKIDLSSAH